LAVIEGLGGNFARMIHTHQRRRFAAVRFGHRRYCGASRRASWR
jgi:hypothetical protein